MKCPKCEEELEARFNQFQIENDHVEIFFDCKNEHQYFVRVAQEDLIKD